MDAVGLSVVAVGLRVSGVAAVGLRVSGVLGVGGLVGAKVGWDLNVELGNRIGRVDAQNR